MAELFTCLGLLAVALLAVTCWWEERQPSKGSSSGASARNARPRWLTASFSSGPISAVVRHSPAGTKIGS
jgi:hypothetical protein